MSVLLVTSLGDIVVDLHADRCPLTSKNFLKLCKIKYYNGCLFHTVQKDFTAQTGDPTGTGTGGDSIYKFLYGDQARFFNDEIHLDLKHSKMGTVAMASAGENLNASQFYITLRDDLDYLDGKHTVFGEVAEGFETLARINEAYLDEDNRPYKNIRIKHTYILEDPFDDPSQLTELIPDASPEGKPKDEVDDKARLEDDWVPMDEQLGTSELEEVFRAKQAHSSAVVLESIGDIPDAEIKPPDNVLFVCKLNPVTEDEDLHTIFSRFGIVTSAEVIRDFKTGDSLCYAFIEFETNEACEQAYFKILDPYAISIPRSASFLIRIIAKKYPEMDNALIDDRRIHVDFSQSVSKLWNQFRRKDNQGKGRGCFKCGALDHIAKDCTGGGGGGDTKQPSKFILKDNNRQHGGSNDSKYEMVFDGDTPAQEKRGRSYDTDDQGEKQKPKKQSEGDLRHRDGEKYPGSRHKESDRNRHKEEMIREDKANRSRREHDQSVERIGSHKHKEKHVDVNGGDDGEQRKKYAESDHPRDYRKRYAEGEGRRDDRDYKKRDVEDEGQRNGRDYKKRDVEGEGQRDDKKRDMDGGDRRDDKKRDMEGERRRDDKKRDMDGGDRRDDKKRDMDGGDRRDDKKRDMDGGDRRDDKKRDMDGGDRRDYKKRDAEGEGHRYHKRDMDGGDRRDYKKREAEGEDHRDPKKRDMGGGDRRGRDEREFRKRDVDGGDRKYDRDYRKRDAESDRRDRRDMKEERGRDR